MNFNKKTPSEVSDFLLEKDIDEETAQKLYENLILLLYLADLLPVVGLKKRKLDSDKQNFPHEALLTFAGMNSSFRNIVREKQCRQPYLLTTDKEDEHLKFFFILDKQIVDVGSCAMKAFDILYK